MSINKVDAASVSLSWAMARWGNDPVKFRNTYDDSLHIPLYLEALSSLFFEKGPYSDSDESLDIDDLFNAPLEEMDRRLWSLKESTDPWPLEQVQVHHLALKIINEVTSVIKVSYTILAPYSSELYGATKLGKTTVEEFSRDRDLSRIKNLKYMRVHVSEKVCLNISPLTHKIGKISITRLFGGMYIDNNSIQSLLENSSDNRIRFNDCLEYWQSLLNGEINPPQDIEKDFPIESTPPFKHEDLITGKLRFVADSENCYAPSDFSPTLTFEIPYKKSVLTEHPPIRFKRSSTSREIGARQYTFLIHENKISEVSSQILKVPKKIYGSCYLSRAHAGDSSEEESTNFDNDIYTYSDNDI